MAHNRFLFFSHREYEHKLEMISLSKATLQRSHDLLQGELDSANTEVNSLKTTVKQVTADASGIKCQLEATKVRCSVQLPLLAFFSLSS